MMKTLGPLAILADYSFDDKTVVIHPNDGYDLGLMTTEYVVKIFAAVKPEDMQAENAKFVWGKIHLKNECRVGTVELSLRTVEKIGKPTKLSILMEDDKLLLQPSFSSD